MGFPVRVLQLFGVVMSSLIPSILILFPGTTEAAEAQDQSEYGVEEIIVTARKRSESLQETPIAISAFSAEDMQERSLTNLMEVGSFAPNVQMSVGASGSGGGNNSQIYIRGIGQIDFLFTTDPGVGTYVDGVYHPRTLGGVLDLLDLERVEILRGPQGTLFGKNTIGGAINVITAKPSREREGSFEITGGELNRLDVRASYNTPLSDSLALRVAVSSKKRDGYAKRIDFNTSKTIDHQGDEESLGARAALRWEPSDTTRADLTLDWTKENEESVPTTLAQFDANAPLAGLWNALVGSPAGTPMSDAFITNDPYTTYGTGPNRNLLDAWGTSLTIEHEFPNVTLKSITAYRETDGSFGRDGDGSPLPIVHTNQDQQGDNFSQELQLTGLAVDNRLTWLLGAFYFEETGIDKNDVRLVSGLYDALEGLPAALICLGPGGTPPCAGGAGNPVNAALDLDFDIYNKIEITSYAFFTHLTYDFSERLSLSGGIRYTYEKKDYTLDHKRVNSGVAIVPRTTVNNDWSEVSPKISLDFQWLENVLAYASISRGFKSGGFNGRPTVASEVESYDPEFVTTYELGIKSELFDHRLRLNGAVFFNDYEDIQVSSVSADSTGNLVLVVDNVASADVSGFELELLARPIPELEISGSLGYIDAEYTDVGSATEISKSSKFVKTPKWNSSLGVQYSLSVGAEGMIRLRADLSYTDKVYQDPQNTESIAQDSFTLTNLRASYEQTSQRWELAAFVTNATDEEYIIAGLQALASFGTAEAVYGPPREYGITFRKWF